MTLEYGGLNEDGPHGLMNEWCYLKGLEGLGIALLDEVCHQVI